jgi:hypothetical protein
MKKLSWELQFGIYLLALSAVMYLLHYGIFRDTHHISLWSLTSLAFLPISVLFVTLLINRVLIRRERRIRIEKLNMLIGIFFSKIGTELLTFFSGCDPGIDTIRKYLVVTSKWTEQEFIHVRKQLLRHNYEIEMRKANLEQLRSFLVEKGDFLVRLLENPNLLEYESFARLLRAIFHLAEELESREDLRQLPDTDLDHLAGDIKRAYVRLIRQWIDYMRYLKKHYPYLFSLAMRKNPFDHNASPVVT